MSVGIAVPLSYIAAVIGRSAEGAHAVIKPRKEREMTPQIRHDTAAPHRVDKLESRCD